MVAISPFFEADLQSLLGRFELLDDAAVVAVAGVHADQLVVDFTEFFVEEPFKEVIREWQKFEAAEGDDDGVVVTGGNARHGPLAVAGGELVFAGDEEIGVRIELEEFGGPLIDQVIGDDEHGFLREAEPFEFHRGRHERVRLAGSHDVPDQGGIRGCWGATGQKTGVRALTTRPGLENETRS